VVYYLIIASLASLASPILRGVVWVVRERRLRDRDKSEIQLVRRAFDKTQDPEVLKTLVELRRAERPVSPLSAGRASPDDSAGRSDQSP